MSMLPRVMSLTSDHLPLLLPSCSSTYHHAPHTYINTIDGTLMYTSHPRTGGTGSVLKP
jgi:hypothetical protein